jgi:cytochrome P450
MSERCHSLGLDTIAQFGFGQSLNLQTRSDNRFLIRGITISAYRQNVYMQFPLLKKLGFEQLLSILAGSMRMKYVNLMKSMVEARMSQNAASQDLFAFIQKAQSSEDGETMPMEEIWTESTLFLVAGKLTRVLTLSEYIAHVVEPKAELQCRPR